MKKGLKRTGLVLAMAGVLVIGTALAYFTDGDTVTNTFTVGRVEVDLQEPSWEPDDVTKITPQEEFAKDPQVKNVGINDAYVFLEITVPCANVKTAGEDGTVNSAAKTQLFSYDLNSNWVAVETDTEDANENRYVYAYVGADKATMEALAPNATTAKLFTHVRFANVVEDEGLEDQNLDIVINTYAIQTDNLNDNDTTVDGNNADGVTSPAEVWKVMKTQSSNTVLDDKTGENVKTDVYK